MSEYVHDTWCFKKYGGTWCFEASLLRGPGGYAEAISRLSETLGGLARIARVEIESPDPTPQGRLLEAPEGAGVSAADGISLIAGWKSEIGLVTLRIDVCAYVRPREGAAPERRWVREPTEIALWARTDSSKLRPELCLSMEHSLFQAWSPRGDDNRELYWLNRPILRELLDRLAGVFGALCEYEDGVQPDGYPEPEPEEPPEP